MSRRAPEDVRWTADLDDRRPLGEVIVAPMSGTLTREEIERLSTARHRAEPPAPLGRRPVHVVYGGAHLFKATTTHRLGEIARSSFERFAATPAELAEALGLEAGPLTDQLHERIGKKLATEPVEDFRIDFEDGYGSRPDEEEDADATRCGAALAEALTGDGATTGLPPFCGMRTKPFDDRCARRALRTLDLFLTTCTERSGGKLPPNFVLTLPKVTHQDEVARFSYAVGLLERRLQLEEGSLGIELMVETPSSLFDSQGRCPLGRFVQATAGRCRSVHFGAYDYTSACEVAAPEQSLRHPACVYARSVMQAALQEYGVQLSDGATTTLPIPPHKTPQTDAERAENRRVVHAAWRLAYGDVRGALREGYYQGWDLHPAQLIPRYAALYGFFLENVDGAGRRLANFLKQAAQATRVGDLFDDAATGQGLLNFFIRAVSCGAIAESDLSRWELDDRILKERSFAVLLARS